MKTTLAALFAFSSLAAFAQSAPTAQTPSATPAPAQAAPAAQTAPAAQAAPAPADTSKPDCSSPDVTQADLDVCAAQDDKTSDGELNRTYAQVRKGFRDSKEKDKDTALVLAERAWIKYRDLNCAAESSLFDGGSMYPEVYSGCLEEMTQARTADLKAAYLTQQ